MNISIFTVRKFSNNLFYFSNDHELYKDFSKGKTSEIHLTSSEVRAGSKIESSLLYEQPLLGLDEAQKVSYSPVSKHNF